MKAQAFVRELPRGLDPLELYTHLTGAVPDTMLFERPDAPTLLLVSAAARIVCRGQNVTVTALGSEGTQLVATLAEAMPDRLVELRGGAACFSFPPITTPDPDKRIISASPFDMLRLVTDGGTDNGTPEPFALAALGVVSFDHVDLLEDLPANEQDPLQFPDLLFWVPESLIVLEPGGQARAVCTSFGDLACAEQRLESLVGRCTEVPPLPKPSACGQADFDRVDISDEEYAGLVAEMKEYILAGDVYQIVPSRTFHAPCPDPIAAFGAQRREDPSPYQFYVAAPEHVLFGCSPETSVRVSGGRKVEVKPIAGTRPRGATVDQDDRLEAELRLDAKEVAEHMMLVDLARNDVARVSKTGSRRVATLLSVERYARVMHLVSSVTGVLKDGLDAVHALQSAMNVGTLSGAPKLRATELLRAAERTKRGPYGGATGWLNCSGEMDMGVIIRSAVVTRDIAFVRVGAGIVHDSNPAAEVEETKRKASALLAALAGQLPS